MTLKAIALLAATCTLIVISPTAPAAEPADCTIVLGGGGTTSHDEKFNSLWLEINKRISERVVADLRNQQYRVEFVFSTAAETEDRAKEVYLNMQLHDCTKVLQITHILTPPPRKNEPAGLAWEVSLMHLEKNAPKDRSQAGQLAGDYSKTYRYPLTDETMEKLSVSGTAEMIVRDVIASGKLPTGNSETPASTSK
jgi:hypothetical protein